MILETNMFLVASKLCPLCAAFRQISTAGSISGDTNQSVVLHAIKVKIKGKPHLKGLNQITSGLAVASYSYQMKWLQRDVYLC